MQIPNERIIKFKISRKEKADLEPRIYYLIVDVFSKGNVLMCDSDMKIITLTHNTVISGRKLLKKEVYPVPEPGNLNFFDIDLENLKSEMRKSELVRD